MKKRKITHDFLQGRLDYSRYDSKGPNASEVLVACQPRDVMIKYYDANIKVTEASAEKITINTMGQSTGEFEQKWLEERRKRITASSVGPIAKQLQK